MTYAKVMIKNYEELVNRLRPYLRTNESGEPKIYVPDITAVHQGKIVGRFKQEQAGKDEEISSPEEFWNGGDGKPQRQGYPTA